MRPLRSRTVTSSRRKRTIMALVVATLGTVSGFATPAFASSTSGGRAPAAASSVHAAQPHRRYSRHVCDARAGRAQCQSMIATDANGRPLVFSHPTNDPTAASGTWSSYGLSPQSFHKAYNLPWRSPVNQTIAVIDAYDHPNEKADLDSFDSAWGLGAFPTCTAYVTTSCFQRVDQNGNNSGFVNNDVTEAAAWNMETNLDVQTAHGICLNCKIMLVEAYTDQPGDLAAAVNTAARLGATEFSNSYGWAESSLKVWNPAAYNHARIAITASSGDWHYGAYYPADLNTVVAVGGTHLNLNSDGSYNSESVWNNSTGATGSGCSTFTSNYTSAAYWQKAVANWSATGCGNQRGIADVAADADPNTGAWVYNSVPNAYGQTGWFAQGGTSLSAPIIAGVYALAGNAAAWTWPSQSLYQHSGSLIDVKSGSDGTCGYWIMCNATTGYDGPTGLGTPWGVGAF